MDSPHLLSLAGLCEAAGEGSRALDWDIHLRDGLDGKGMYGSHPHYSTSLDAAVSLVPDGMLWMLTNTGVQNRKEPDFTKATALVSNWRDTDTDETQASTPALALCAAALRALSQSHSQTERGEA